MQRPDNIDTKNSLEKPQNDSSHHDNSDVGQYKEENASNHNKNCPEIIQNFLFEQVLMLATQKVWIKSTYELIWQDTHIFQRIVSDTSKIPPGGKSQKMAHIVGKIT
jgi:hypothetical protein